MAEYNTSGTLLNRYIHGAGTDDPLVWYTGTGTSNKRYLLADERGSIVSETDASGNEVETHRYCPYGEPINQSTSRFRYTGQILIPGTELYHYKARVYHPKLGRFLQTDPIGYEDGMNWYAYGGNDPVNMVDPGGKTAESFFVQGKTYENFGQAVSGAWGDLKQSLDSGVQNSTPNVEVTAAQLDTASDALAGIAVVATAFGQAEIAGPAALGSTITGIMAEAMGENPVQGVMKEVISNNIASKTVGTVGKIASGIAANAPSFVKNGINAADEAIQDTVSSEIKDGMDKN